MNREVQVRICEGLGVNLPGPTRPRPKSRPAASGSAFWGEPVAAATCSAWLPVTQTHRVARSHQYASRGLHCWPLTLHKSRRLCLLERSAAILFGEQMEHRRFLAHPEVHRPFVGS